MTTATGLRFNVFEGSKHKAEVETTLSPVSDKDMQVVELDKNKCLFRILNQKDGDKRIVWDKMRTQDIDAARKLFNDLIGQGLTAHRVDPSTGKSLSSVMEEFDPTAEEVIFLPTKLLSGG